MQLDFYSVLPGTGDSDSFTVIGLPSFCWFPFVRFSVNNKARVKLLYSSNHIIHNRK